MIPERARIRPVLITLVAAGLFGAATPIAKTLLGSMGPFRLAGLLYLGAAAAVAPAAVARGLPDRRLLRRDAARIAGVVVFGGIFAPVLLLTGLSSAPAASVSLWLNLEPLATVVFAHFLFKEHLHGRGWISLLLVLAASLFLVWPGGFQFGFAALFVALACACWGLDNNLTALIGGLTPSQTTLVKGTIAGFTNLGIGLLAERSAATARIAVEVLVVGALCYGASLVLYITAAQQLGAARSQLVFATAPFLGVLLAWTFLSEPVLPMQLVAGSMMLIALWTLQGERHEHEHSHGAVTHVHWHRHDDLHHAHAHDGGAPAAGHTHEHSHEPTTHSHPHQPDLEHRHRH